MNCTHWLGRLANLNTARTAARGIAPHKPLMLLSVIDLIESGDIPDGWVKYDVRLVSRFRDYWELVLERQRNQPDISTSTPGSGQQQNILHGTRCGTASEFQHFSFPIFSFYSPMDIFTPEKRSEVMSRIRGRDTKPELALRVMIHRLGYRFTVHGPKNKSLPGNRQQTPHHDCGSPMPFGGESTWDTR